MSNQITVIDVELLSETNLHPLTELTIEFWQDCNYEEELLNWEQIINDTDNYCALAKLDERYVGFIHMTIRNDYVEGSNTDKTAYLEAIYIKNKLENMSFQEESCQRSVFLVTYSQADRVKFPTTESFSNSLLKALVAVENSLKNGLATKSLMKMVDSTFIWL